MLQSARRLAGIVRNVLPRKLLQRKKWFVFGSDAEHNKAKWKRKTDALLKTASGRQYLSKHFRKMNQQYLKRNETPSKVIESDKKPVVINENLKQLCSHVHNQIMRKAVPLFSQIPSFRVGKQNIYLPSFVIALKTE
jgi:hypothetical protein